jgi:hypothetical protein
MAFGTAVEGGTAETERLVRVWLREATQDLAEPSQVMPFVEPNPLKYGLPSGRPSGECLQSSASSIMPSPTMPTPQMALRR